MSMASNSESGDALFSQKPVLSIETATPVCSVAIRLADGTIYERSAEGKGVHSEQTFVFIHELLSRGKLAVEDLGAVIVSAGPGSYTGLRVASSAVKGLLFRTEVPLYACNTLGSIALGAWQVIRAGRTAGEFGALLPQTPENQSGMASGTVDRHAFASGPAAAAVCDAVIDARRNHLYHQSWKFLEDGVEPVSEVMICELEEVLERLAPGRIVAGTGVDRLRKLAGATPENLAMMPDYPLQELVNARHILAMHGLPSRWPANNLIKKVAPEHFEPYYYTGL